MSTGRLLLHRLPVFLPRWSRHQHCGVCVSWLRWHKICEVQLIVSPDVKSIVNAKIKIYTKNGKRRKCGSYHTLDANESEGTNGLTPSAVEIETNIHVHLSWHFNVRHKLDSHTRPKTSFNIPFDRSFCCEPGKAIGALNRSRLILPKGDGFAGFTGSWIIVPILKKKWDFSLCSSSMNSKTCQKQQKSARQIRTRDTCWLTVETRL